jgi:hypothetical protein
MLTPSNPLLLNMQVLFCSHHFTDGFLFSKEFLADEPGIEVRTFTEQSSCSSPDLQTPLLFDLTVHTLKVMVVANLVARPASE